MCRGARKQHKKTRDFLVIDLLHEQRFNAPFITFQKGKVPFNNGDCRFVPGDCRFVLEPSGKSRVPTGARPRQAFPAVGLFQGRVTASSRRGGAGPLAGIHRHAPAAAVTPKALRTVSGRPIGNSKFITPHGGAPPQGATSPKDAME